MPKKRDLYEILGVSRGASTDEIKRAYRSLAKKHHPDRNPNDATAETRFKEVQHAYDILRDDKKRADYDRFGEVGVGEFSTGGAGQKVYQWGGGSTVNIDDLEDLFGMFGGGGGGRPNIFEQMFGQRGADTRPRPRAKSADEEVQLDLTFGQAVRGDLVTIKIRRGSRGNTEALEFKVPAGVTDGQRIRLRGRGQPGGSRQESGDLYLVCRVKPHPFFRRDGADIVVEVPVTITEAVLGGKIDVPTLDGPVTMTLPAGTSGGSKLRLKGRGVPAHGNSPAGDQFVVIQIVTPPSLDRRQKELFESLRELEKENPRERLAWKSKS